MPPTPAQPAPVQAPRAAEGFFARLNPVALLAGPVFQKEMRVSGRRKGTYWARALFAFGLIGLVSIVFVSLLENTRYYSGVQQVQAFQSFAPAIANAVVWFQFIVVLVAAPVLTSGAICDERRFRSLSALATTPLRPSQIVAGKLASRMVQLIILSLITAPLLLAVRTFGGLEASFVLSSACVTLSTALLAASLALWASNWAVRPTNAASFAVLIMILYCLYPFGGMLMEFWSTGSPPSMNWLMYSPAFVLFVICAPMLPGMAFNPNTFWFTIVGINLGLSALVCVLATRRLAATIRTDAAAEPASLERKARKRRAATAAPQTPSTTTGSQAADAPEPVEYERTSRTVGDNPVLWRELRQAAFRSRARLAVLIITIAIFAFITYFNAGFDEPTVTAVFGVIAAVLLLLQSSNVSAGTVTGEVESRTWSALVTTTLTPEEIIRGKILGSLRRLWLVPALFMAHCVLAVIANANNALIFILFPLIVAGPAVFLCTTGVLFSLRARKTTTAAVCNLLLGAALWAGLPLLIAVITEAVRFSHRSFLGGVFDVVICGNPVFLVGSAAAGTGTRRGNMRFEMPWRQIRADDFLLVCIVGLVVYLGASYILYRLAVRRFSDWSVRRI